LATIESIENYNDMVWCVKVPTGAFVARRNGQIFVTGNSGFAKSHDVGKAIDSYFDKKDERKKVGLKDKASRKDGSMVDRESYGGEWKDNPSGWQERGRDPYEREPATDEAKKWSGWDTQLKPAKEPIIIARKPLDGTVAENVLNWGTGGINIDNCRIETGNESFHVPQSDPKNREGEVGTDLGFSGNSEQKFQESQKASIERLREKGRWPANIIFDRAMAKQLDEQSGECRTGNSSHGGKGGMFNLSENQKELPAYHDKGGASRFFYCPKASTSERNLGVEENDHPTVKPVELMGYLIRLVTPEGGKLLDPFGGSGTTGMAAVLEQKEFVIVEKDKDSADLAESRIKHVENNYQRVREKIYGDPSNQLTDEQTEVNDHEFW
jgi:hypothetical protein